MSSHHTEATNSEHATSQQTAAPPRLSVIGIGASAGGLAALRTFFSALPEQSGLAFVVVIHLSPEHESMLAALLQPYTAMPVTQVIARTEMQADHVYVIPPGKHLVVADRFLDLAELEPGRNRQSQIDAFFRSLAENHGDGGAVILSGSGSDGAVGIQAIKEQGGLLFVQAPDEAEYDGMPRSAIATGLVDMVAPAAELATQLVAAKQTLASIQLPADGKQLSTAAQTTLIQILAQLRVRTGHDFSGYKPATILRRIARRMQITQLTTLTAYLQRLRQDTHEAEALFRDLLINVTEFFRDPETWTVLASAIIPQLFAGKGRDDRVRVWSVGCATGEEAYSIAMLLLEYAGELVAPPAIQVFASDLGKAALDFAREGSYPAAIADNLTDVRLARFFTKENSHYRVRPELRETILFTQHNLLQEPPFSRLDLILCRNLLIYIQRDLQEKLFETFYYALRPEGYLFLGNAESAEGISDLFETVDKRGRLYQRRAQSKATPILPSLPLLPKPTHGPLVGAETPSTIQLRPSEEHRLLLDAVAPPSVLVDRDYHVLHLSETAGRYLLPPGGAPTVELLKLVRPELQSELRAALLRAFDENRAVATRPLPVRFNGAPHPVYLMVRPHQLADGQMRALVIFWEDETPITNAAPSAGPDDLSQPARQQLEAELRNAQGRLQGMREEYETTVEELRAANEELQSTNEEYKSTLEELETSKEELQSVNEELQTINQELKNKIEEVTHTHNDLQNLFIATEIATLFLDRELRVKRYTPRTVDLFNLMPPDRGRPIAHLRTNLRYEQLEADAQRVLTDLIPVEREVQSQGGRWFLVRLRPYRTLEDRIDGVVITFVDITSNKANETALRDAKEYAESIVHTIPDALLVLEPDLRVQMANDAFYTIFQVNPAATEGRLIYELGNGQWDIPALRTLLEEILPQNKVFIGYEVAHTFEGIGRRAMLVNGRQLDHAQLILLAITDITERKQHEQWQAFLLQLSDALRSLADAVAIQAAVTSMVMAYFGADRCYYCEIEENQAIIRRDAARADLPSVVGVYPLADFPLFSAMMNQGVPLVVQDTKRTDALDAALSELCLQMQINAFINVPVVKAQQYVGNLCLTQSAPRQWTDFEVRLAQEIAERTWTAVERARAEEALHKSEENYRLFISATADVVYKMSADWRTMQSLIGKAFIATTTAPRLDWTEGYIPATDQQLVWAAIEHAIQTKGNFELEHRVIRLDGSIGWTFSRAIPLLDESGEIVEWIGAASDITERKRAEEALHKSEEKYRTLFNSIDDAFALCEIVVDNAGKPIDYCLLDVNPAFEQMTGITPTAAQGKTARELVPTIEDWWIETYGKVALQGETIRFENRVAEMDRWFDAYASPVGEQREGKFALVFKDISERKRREANLAFLAELSAEFAPYTQADELMLRLCAKLGHYLTLSRCDFSIVDEAADRITTLYDWRRDADTPSVEGEHAISTFLTLAARQHYVAGNMAVVNDTHHDPKINAPPAMMDALRIRAVVDSPFLENGAWKFLVSVCRSEVSVWRADEIELIREVTARVYMRLERSRAEEALRESEGRLRVMIENLPGGAVFIVDRDLRYLLAEGEALHTAGFAPSDLIGKSLFDALPLDVATTHEPMYRQALAGTPFLHEHESYSRAYVSRGTPLRGADGEVYGVLVVSYDITDRKAAEVALQHLNATLEQQVDTRTEQVRALASELTMAEQEERRRISQILHDDLQQLLYGIQMRVMAMLNDLKANNSAALMAYAQEVYNWMSDAIQTTRRLTVDLSPPLLKGEGLADALRWLIPQMATVNGLQVTLEVVEPCEITNQGMRVLLFQVVRELLFNVVKHAGVNTATVVLQEEGDVCMIKVSDTGHGFDPATVAAKGEKGLGLFSINERLKLFGGHMEIQSAPGQGAQITVYAPVGTTAQRLR